MPICKLHKRVTASGPCQECVAETRLETIGSRIRFLRQGRGLSKRQLADIAGFNITTIAAYERDRLNPSATSVVALCRALKTSADYMLGIES